MNILVLTIFLVIIATGLFLLIMAVGKIRDLERAKRILREGK